MVPRRWWLENCSDILAGNHPEYIRRCHPIQHQVTRVDTVDRLADTTSTSVKVRTTVPGTGVWRAMVGGVISWPGAPPSCEESKQQTNWYA